MYSNQDYLSDLLVARGTVTPDEITKARDGVSPNQGVVDLLVAVGDVTEEQVAQTIAENAGTDYVDLGGHPFTEHVFQAMDVEVAQRFQAVPLEDDGTYMTVAVADALDFETLDSLPHVVGREVRFVSSTPSAITKVLHDNYGVETEEADTGTSFTVITEGETEEADANDAPIIRMVSNMLLEAFRMRASDIHVEPMETTLRVRFRVDGRLVEVESHPKRLLPAIVARVKVMSGTMSIAEKRVPQDGRIQMRIGGKEVDLRVSTVPSNHGESIVMRILDKSSLLLGLPELGFFTDDEAIMREMMGLPDGIMLVTGPTGSGKTTTLYACLNYINKPDRKIITVEDPIEYQLPGINQVMVKSDIGMTFGAALRAMLRQAPNIIMVGEIRDVETASIAINASLTGHLVFSTLHTNDAPSAVARLADIGVQRFLIASAVRAVMAQRLVRALCKDCKGPAELSDAEMRMLRLDPAQLEESSIMGPVGCETCRQSGYRGRQGIFEIFKVDDEVRHLINEDLSTPQLRRRARELGMRTLREDGYRKVLAGVTSASEVISVTMSDAD
ncbi:MAG TPA: type II secretion system protein E [Verrucomicrobiales bacterium]|nr:type II secretion system protein E [Verrucomicrobiales bacterium]